MKLHILGQQIIQYSFFIFLGLVNFTNTQGQELSIRNGPGLIDTDGNVVHAHGVGIIKEGNTYFMIGEDRRNIYTFKGVNMYSSQDLVNWKFENTIISDSSHPDLANKSRFIERPKIIYNGQTQEYVIWVHWESANYGAAEAAVFKSATINGSYTFVRNMRPNNKMARDCNLFVDDDGTAYFIAAGDDNATLYLHELTDDYLNVTGNYWKFFENQNREAPVIFKDDGIYYMLSSGLTGWAPNQGTYATAQQVTGPWSSVADMGNSITYNTQPAHIIPVRGSQDTTWIYIGDRWQDPNLVMSRNIFLPLEVENGVVQLNYVHQWSIDLATGTWQQEDFREKVSKTNWSVVSVSSEETTNEPGQATNAIDGDLTTFWHANWSQGSNHPHELIIDLGGQHTVNGFSYIPRQDGNTSGILETFHLYLGTDGISWGDPVAGGWIAQQADIGFQATEASYARLVTYSSFDDNLYVTMAEFDLYTNSTCSDPVKVQYEINGTATTPQPGSQTISVNTGENLIVKVADKYAFGSTIWTGPQGYFDSTDEFDERARALYFDQFEEADTGRYVLTYLNERHCASTAIINIKSTGQCGSSLVTPYYRVGTQDWSAGTDIDAFLGDVIDLGPQPTSGSWTWSGCDTSGTNREQTIQPTASCTAVATFTNLCGAQSTVTYHITLKSGAGLSGTYRIVNRNSAKALRPLGGNTTPGTPVVQYSLQNLPGELWQVEEVSPGKYTIKHLSSGLFADISDASTLEGAANIIWNKKINDNANQQWRLLDQQDGYFHIVNVNSGLNLDISGASLDNDAACIQWSDNGGNNQDWSLQKSQGQNPVLGLGEVSHFELFPNPFTDRINIQLSEKPTNWNVVLRDQAGRIHYRENGISAGVFSLQPGNLLPGLYILTIFSEAQIYSMPLIKR